MKKNKKLPGIITILILTIVTILFWVSINIYWAWTKKPDPVVPTDVLIQLDPKLDLDTLNQVKNRN